MQILKKVWSVRKLDRSQSFSFHVSGIWQTRWLGTLCYPPPCSGDETYLQWNDGDLVGLPTIYQFWFKAKSNHGIWIYPLRYSREMRRSVENQSPKTGSLKGHIWALSGPLKIPRPIKDWSLTLHQTIPKENMLFMPTLHLHLQYETMFSKLLITLKRWRKGWQYMFTQYTFTGGLNQKQ